MKTITIIGESPSRTSEHALLDSRGCERLAQLLELETMGELTKLARVVNLIGFHPNGNFPLRVASLAAKSLELSPVNIFLGYKVASCFGFNADHELLTWYVLPGDIGVAIMPHPSGTRWWSDPKNLKIAKDFLWEVFYEDEEDEQDEDSVTAGAS